MININYWAVLGAAVVNMVVGSLWFGPLFGKMWKNLMGFTDESMKKMSSLTMTQAMLGGAVTSLIMAYVLARFIAMAGIMDVKGALLLACWIWLGFMATVHAGMYLWEGKPFKLFVLVALESFVALHLMAVVLVMF